MLRKRGLLAFLAVAGAAAMLAGCLLSNETIGSGEATRTWRGGKLTKNFGADYEKVWAAASGAVREMKLGVDSEQHDALVGRIHARRVDDIAVRLDVDNLGEKQTRVVVWVGAIGRERDKQCAMAVMDCIDRKLGK